MRHIVRRESTLFCAVTILIMLTSITLVASAEECPLYGQHKLDGAVMFEAAHPHKQYVVCDCGFAQYTGGTVDYYAECEVCNPRECQHQHTDIAWDTSYSMTYVPISDTQHQASGYQYEYCTNCFKHIGSSYKVTEILNHDFNKNGDCPTCGYTHACPHSRTYLVAIDGYPAYHQYSETQHIVDTQYKEVCRDCDVVVRKLVDSAREYEYVDHTFNKKGICRYCGYVKPVKQEPLKINVSANQSSAEMGTTISASASATGGDGSYSFAWIVTCNGRTVANTDLSYGNYYSVTASQVGYYVFTATVYDGNGNNISANSGTITVNEPPCQHPTKEVAWDTINSIVSVSDIEHEITGYQHYYCTVCFEHIGSRFAATERVQHDFDSAGDCPTCGYTHSCKHENTKYVPIDGYPAYHQYDAKQHIYDVQFKEVCTNPTCGKTVKRLVDSERVYEYQDHRFDASGKCQDCGYIHAEEQEPLSVIVSREHATAKTGSTISAKATVTGGDGNYKFSWMILLDGKVEKVTDLGMGDSYSTKASRAGTYVFSVTVIDGSNNSATSSSAGITVSQSECQHNFYTDVPGAPKYEQVSDAKHKKITPISRVCNTCGKTISEYQNTVSENHSFVDGICVDCGLVEPTIECLHEHTKEVITDSRITNRGNTKQHIVTETYSVICKDCSITVRTFEKRVRVNHDFNANGVCACGYAKPTRECDHANRVEVQISTPAYVNNSDSDHTKTVKVRVECADCGITLQEEKTVTVTESHSFEDGVCACGQSEHVHSYVKNLLSSVVEKDNNSKSTHFVVNTYVEICECGATNNTSVVRTTAQCTFVKNAGVQAKHENKGHQYFDRCSCGNAVVNGRFTPYLSSCSTCRQQYGDNVLAKGSFNSSKVEELQQMLGFTGKAVDGDFGDNTESAVIEFQKKHGLPATGIVDDATWAKLVAESNMGEINTSSAGLLERKAEQGDQEELDESFKSVPNEYKAFVDNGSALEYLNQIIVLKNASAYKVASDAVIDDFADGGFDVWVKSLYNGLTSKGAVDESIGLTEDEELALMLDIVREMVNSDVVHEDSMSSDVLNSTFDIVANVSSYTTVLSGPIAQCLYQLGYDPITAANKSAELVGADGISWTDIDYSKGGNFNVSALSYGLTAISTIMDCCDIYSVSMEQKEALIKSVLEYDANMQALDRIIDASTGPLRTAAKQVQKELKDAYIGQFDSIKQDAVTGLLTTGGNTLVNLLDFTAPIRAIYRLTTNQTAEKVDAEFAFIEYSMVISKIQADCVSAISSKDEAAYDLLQLYCIGLQDAYDNTYEYYESYGKTWSGKIVTAFGNYNNDEILGIISQQKQKIRQLQEDMIDDIQ